MQRPGNISGFHGFTPKRQTSSAFSGYSGLGTFGKSQGKGVGSGMPSPPPPEATPARYIGGKWVCSGAAPEQTKDGYYHCCPGGWTMTNFQVTRPCGDDYGQTVCGQLPPGASAGDAVCCENLKEWVPNTADGRDPCRSAEDALMAQGKVVAGRAESMLAPELIIDQGPLISPTLMMAGGVAVAALFLVTIVIKLKS